MCYSRVALTQYLRIIWLIDSSYFYTLNYVTHTTPPSHIDTYK